MTADMLIRYRAIFMGTAGVVCLAYGVLALLMGRPDPVWPFLPGAAGVLASVVIFSLFARAKAGSRRAARDEVYRLEHGRALAVGFWVGMLLYPLFAPFLAYELIAFPVAFAAMGTLMAAAYLLSFAVVSLRGV